MDSEHHRRIVVLVSGGRRVLAADCHDWSDTMLIGLLRRILSGDGSQNDA